MSKKAIVLMVMMAAMLGLSGCGSKETASDNKKVLIYSSAEEYRIEYMQKRLNEQFPDHDIVIEYMSTGNLAAKLKAESTKTQADIIQELEYGYLDQLKDNFAVLSDYDPSIFVDDMRDSDNKYLPEYRNGGCITVNTEVLQKKGLPEPTGYQDLLRPEYKGLISMPSPKSSGTGYMFLKNLVNVWGEEEAFQYFDALSANILQFTSSGSGPVNALVQGEAAIGLAMIGQSVTEINKGAPLKILFFEEGAPCAFYGMTILKGKENRPAVKDVFNFFYTTLNREDKQLFYPEKVYKDTDYIRLIENYPTDIPYGNMSNNTPEEKTRLLEKWAH